MRNSKKKLALVMFIALNLIQLSACHNRYDVSHDISYEVRNLVIDQKSRISHASEILKDKAISRHLLHQRLSIGQIKDYIRSQNPKLDADKLAEAITLASRKYNYDPIFLLAIIKTESRFNSNAVGAVGEIGLMQIKPTTAEWIAKKKNFPWINKDELFNPEYNIHLGALYFKYLKKSLNSKASDYINAYNMGPGALRRVPAENDKVHTYFERVVKNYISIYQSFEKTDS